MKIGLETSALSKKLTGTGRYINCLIEQFGTTGNELIQFSRSSIIRKQGFAEGLLNLSRGGIQRHLYRHLLLSREMEREGVDCGIFPNYFMPSQFTKPSAIIIHDLSFITHPQFYSRKFVIYYSRQLRETLKKKPIVATVSENSMDQIHRHLGIKKQDIFLIQGYSEFHKDNIDLSETTDSSPYLLYVGHVEPRKNLHFLIENFLAWKKERRINIRLIIAGEIWIKSSSINILLNKYMYHPEIKFTGYVGEGELHKLYTNAAGFVHTSLVEGFGFPVLEAMHYNLPIICSRGTATEEISSPGSIVINPQSNNSFKQGLDLLYSKYTLRINPKYQIKYSPELMNYQLNTILDLLEMKTNYYVFANQRTALNTKEAVEKTLLYANLFNSGISRDLLLKSLFDIQTTEKKLDFAVRSLLDEKTISMRNNSFYLNTPGNGSYKKERENKKLKKSLLFLKLLNYFPLISVISFSGGTAHYGLKHHNDIDLFIITKANCLYPVYAVIHLLSFIFGLRNAICANYLISENNLAINSQRDFYTAHQIISLVPYKNELGFNKFLIKNEWINYFFPNFEIKKTNFKPASRLFGIFAPLNIMIMWFYKSLYKRKIIGDKTESLKLTIDCLKLHTNDHRAKTTSMFESEWKKYCENKDKSTIKLFKTDAETYKEGTSTILKELKTKIKLPA